MSNPPPGTGLRATVKCFMSNGEIIPLQVLVAGWFPVAGAGIIDTFGL